jgi:methylmalonyl-CoA/ethylmalonyl-CoA epimerase
MTGDLPRANEGLHVDHVGIVVKDLEQATAILARLFGIEVDEALDARDRLGVKTVFYNLANISIELLEPADDQGRAARLGDDEARIEHICFRVDDIEQAAADLTERGARWASDAPVPVGRRLVRFSAPESTGGVMFQLLQQT